MKTQNYIEQSINRIKASEFIGQTNEEFGKYMQQLIRDGEAARFEDHFEFMFAALKRFIADKEEAGE